MVTFSDIHQKYIKRNFALYCVLLAELCSSMMMVGAKLLQSDENPMSTLQILVARMSITYVGTVIYMYWTGVSEAPWGPKKHRLLLSARGLLGFMGVTGLYASVKYISLSDSIIITFLSPTVTTILAAVILKERISLIEIGGGFLSLLGVVLIARPAFLFHSTGTELDKNVESADPHERVLGIIAAFIGVFCTSTVYILIRFMGSAVNPVLTVSYYAIITFVLSALLIALNPNDRFVLPNSLLQWVLLISIGISGFFMQFLFTLGLQNEKASKTSLMMYSQILFGLVWEFVIWHHIPGLFSWIGIIIVIGSAVFTVVYKSSRETDVNYSEVETDLPNEYLEINNIQLKDLNTTTTTTLQRELSSDSFNI